MPSIWKWGKVTGGEERSMTRSGLKAWGKRIYISHHMSANSSIPQLSVFACSDANRPPNRTHYYVLTGPPVKEIERETESERKGVRVNDC